MSGGDRVSCIAALTAAEGILRRFPAGQAATARLTASMLRLAVSREGGDLAVAATAADRAEALLRQVPGDVLVRDPGIRARVLAGRGIVELWSGRLEEAAAIFGSGADAATAAGAEREQAECRGYLALVEAWRGGLGRAAEQAARARSAVTVRERQPGATGSNPAATVAMAWVCLERNELAEARGLLNQADAALGARPDKLLGALAWLIAARIALVQGRAQVPAQCVAKARAGWRVPGWLEPSLADVESRACLAGGDRAAALAAAARVSGDGSPEAAVIRARAWAAAGDSGSARRALAPVLAAHSGTPERVRVAALLVDAQISYGSASPGRGARSLASALRLAEREQLRLPFVTEREWMGQALARDPELARGYHRLLAPTLPNDQRRAARTAPEQSPIVLVEPLTEREREVLRHVSEMLNTAEVASEMYISVNTVKTHLKSIYRKLAATHRREAVRRAQQLELI